MEIVDLSTDDPDIEMKKEKKVRKKFNELKKYLPFLNYVFDLNPVSNSKCKILINWLKIKNHSSLDYCHVVACETSIKRRYDTLKKTMIFPSHIIEIFEGGISIVISDEEDSTPPNDLRKYNQEKHSSNVNENINTNAITKEQSSTSIKSTSQKLESSKANAVSKKKEQQNSRSVIKISEKLECNKPKTDESLLTREKKSPTKSKKINEVLSTREKNKESLSSSSKTSSNRRNKDSLKEKKKISSSNIDASSFDIVPLSDLEKKIGKSHILENFSPKKKNDTLTESDERKKKKNKHTKQVDKISQSIIKKKYSSYENLLKQKKEIKKLLKEENRKTKYSNNGDSNCTPEKLQTFELFKRRESSINERRKSFIEAVLKKNPEITAEVVNDSLGTKIVFDYTNSTKNSTSKTMPVTNGPKSNILQLQSKKGITSETPETNNNLTAGDAYRKAMHEQQCSLQFQESFQSSLLHQPDTLLSNSSVRKMHQTTYSTKPRSISNSTSKAHEDQKISPTKQLISHNTDNNTKNLNSYEIREKSTEIKTKHKNCIETLRSFSNSSKPMQKVNDEVVLISFDGKRKLMHRTESECSLEDYVMEQIVSTAQLSSCEKVTSKEHLVKNKADATSKQLCRKSKECVRKSSKTTTELVKNSKETTKKLCSSSNSLKNTTKKSKECDGKSAKEKPDSSKQSCSISNKSSKTKPDSVNHSNEIKMPILFRKDEICEDSEHKTLKSKHNVLSKKMEIAGVQTLDYKTTKSKKDSTKDDQKKCSKHKSLKHKHNLVSNKLKSRDEASKINGKKMKTNKDLGKDEPRKSSGHKTMKPKLDSVSKKLEIRAGESSKLYHKTTKTKHDSVDKKSQNPDVFLKTDYKTTKQNNDSNNDIISVDLTLKEKNCNSESKNSKSKTQSRNNSVNQNHDVSSMPKILKIFEVNDRTSELREVENEINSNKSADKTIKIKENRKQIERNIESIEPIAAPKNSTLRSLKLKLHDCLQVNKSKTEDSSVESTNNTTKLKEKFHGIQKDLKRKTSKECTKDINNLPAKKSKISTEKNREITPEKTQNSRRFYRELNNLTCAFKESLFPKTIERRRCSSSWLNLSESVNQTSKNKNSELTSAPIKRRRQTYCAMPTLKITLKRSSVNNDEYHVKDIESERSSDETEEFDIEEHHERNKSNPEISESGVISETNLDSSYKKIPRLIPFKSIPIQTPNKSLRNTDSKMTFKSTRTCVLCKKNSNDLTSHYVVKHKTESYVSRLSAADIHGLEKEKNVAIPLCKNRYRMTCVFCKQMIEDHFQNFYAHFSFHTGEYNFQCEGCKITKPYKEDIGSHQQRSRVCRNSKIIKIHQYDFETSIINLHVCTICNYVNLNEFNLKNHIQKQHSLMSNELENSKKCILLVKDCCEIVKDVHPADFRENNYDTGPDTPAEIVAPLFAEQDFICELSVNIHNILMNEDNLAANGIESHEEGKANVQKAIIRQKCDGDEAIGSSPEMLLEEMHAPKNIRAKTVLVETTCKSGEAFSKDIHAEDNRNKSVPDFQILNELSNSNNKITFDDLQASENLPNIVNLVQCSKKRSLNHKSEMETQNDSESVATIEAYIKSTNKTHCQSPKKRIPNLCTHKNSLASGKEVSEILLHKLISNEKLTQTIENSLEELNDLESVTSIEEYIKDTSKVPRLSSERQVNNSSNKEICQSPPTPINLEELASPENLNEESNVEEHFEDFHDSESLTDIEAYIESSKEKLCKSPESRTQDLNNSMLINHISKEKLSKSPKRDLVKLMASKRSNEEPSHNMGKIHVSFKRNTQMQKLLLQSSIKSSSAQNGHLYRQYESLNFNNFGLLKCLIEDCLYSTNSESEFKMHCSNHKETNLLHCPYCVTKSSSFEDVILHVWRNHSMSNYQCVKCSYRSIVPGNVIIHRRLVHKDNKNNESIFECGYLKMSKENKCKIRDNKENLKCPDCSYRFFSMASIKSHLQESHPLKFQRFISLNLNELACIHCEKVSNYKEMMQNHLALQHPDEPAFVIKRKLKVKDCEDPVADLTVIDISIDVLETDIRILKESEIAVNLNKEHEVQDLLEPVVPNSQVSTNSPVMPLNSPIKSSRLTDNCTINNQPGQRSEAEGKVSFDKLKKIEETLHTKGDFTVELSSACPEVSETHQNEKLQTLKNVSNDPVQSFFVDNDQAVQIQEPEQIQTTKEPLDSPSIDSNQPDYLEDQNNLSICSRNEHKLPMCINNDHNKSAQLENRKFEEAVAKEGERLKYLLEVLVENTGVHTSTTLYRCPHCNASFMHFELWLTHIKNKHKNYEEILCPCCNYKLQLDSAISHFKNHLRHEYICYYCITTCCSNEKIQEHFSQCHDNCKYIELPIASFYVVIKRDAIIGDYRALLEDFAEAIYLHLTKKIKCNTVNEWTGGLTDTFLYEMEIPKYKPEGSSLMKCFVKLCSFVASDENSFHDHLVQHEVPKTFECTYCNYFIAYPNWESIKCHIFQHLSACLHVCCVCKFVHHNYDDIIKHIKNLHNSRDVPVICLLRGTDSNYKVSLSIFLPPNKISFLTSKACFCCAQELKNGNKYLDHLKKVHKLFLCPRCQLCDKIIFTRLDGEAHCKEHHQMESFKIKYEVSTSYLYNMILTARSPLTMEIRLKKEKSVDQQMESNPNESKSSSVTIKEEIIVKGELEDEPQVQKMSIKCLNTNQLFENQFGKDANTFQQHPYQSNEVVADASRQLQTFSVNGDIQNSTGEILIVNNSEPSEEQNSESSTQHQQQVNTVKSTSSKEQVHPSITVSNCLPLTNTVNQYSSKNTAITKEVPLLPQTTISHSTQSTASRCSFPSTNNKLRSLLCSKSKNVVTQPSNCLLSNCEQDSLPSSQTHVVIQNIQLETGNAILSIPLETSTRVPENRIVQESQRIPVITRTRVAQPNIQQVVAPPACLAIQSYIQANTTNLVEIAPICGNCNLECIDFIHLQAHFEATHAINNQRFYFYVNRKIGCVYCRFQGTVKSFAQHFANSHPGKLKLCFNLIDPMRCGICNDIFRHSSSSLTPMCACPGYQRTIADCLDLPTLKNLQDIGYQYFKYSCDVCELSFPSAPYLAHHYVSIHHQLINPELWRTRLKYYCFACPFVMSYNLFEIVYHMRNSHLITMGLSISKRYLFYKKIRIAHPNGLLVALDDLRNTGEFDEESFKQIIYNFEAQ